MVFGGAAAFNINIKIAMAFQILKDYRPSGNVYVGALQPTAVQVNMHCVVYCKSALHDVTVVIISHRVIHSVDGRKRRSSPIIAITSGIITIVKKVNRISLVRVSRGAGRKNERDSRNRAEHSRSQRECQLVYKFLRFFHNRFPLCIDKVIPRFRSPRFRRLLRFPRWFRLLR